MGKLQMLAAKGTPSGVNERVQDEAETRGWRRPAVEVLNHQWHCRHSGLGCGAEKSSSPVRRSICRQPSPPLAAEEEGDVEGFLSDAVAEINAITSERSYNVQTQTS